MNTIDYTDGLILTSKNKMNYVHDANFLLFYPGFNITVTVTFQNQNVWEVTLDRAATLGTRSTRIGMKPKRIANPGPVTLCGLRMMRSGRN